MDKEKMWAQEMAFFAKGLRSAARLDAANPREMFLAGELSKAGLSKADAREIPCAWALQEALLDLGEEAACRIAGWTIAMRAGSWDSSFSEKNRPMEISEWKCIAQENGLSQGAPFALCVAQCFENIARYWQSGTRKETGPWMVSAHLKALLLFMRCSDEPFRSARSFRLCEDLPSEAYKGLRTALDWAGSMDRAWLGREMEWIEGKIDGKMLASLEKKLLQEAPGNAGEARRKAGL